MIDLRWTELSFELSLLFNLAFIFYIVVYYRKCVNNQLVLLSGKVDVSLILFSLLLIILVSANSGSDWYSYQDLVWNYDFRRGVENYGEPIYGYLIRIVNRNYLLFRLIVWGGAFLLTCLTFKRFEISINVAVYFLMAVYLLKFNYARATLAMACYFFGLSFLLKPIKGKRLISILLIALFFWGAYEFHHSILPVLVFSVIAFLPLEKPVVLLLLAILLPLFAYYLKGHFDLIDSFGDEYLSSRLDKYLEKEGGVANLLGKIADVLFYGTLALPFVFDTITLVKYGKRIESWITRLFRVTICIFLFSISFVFMGLSSAIFTYRYLLMAFIPLTIVSVYLYQNKYLSKFSFSFILFWGIMANMQSLLVGLLHTQ